jgi:hypothetical protein
MRILVACEESQAVTIEFRKLGHEAYSCDIEPCSGGYPEWHLQQDVTPLLAEKWDMIIAFPPCTYLSNAGARHLWAGGKLNEDRYNNGLKGKGFFMMFYNHDCPRIAIENPVSSRVYDLPPSTQIIQPYEHGHPYSKKTCLWLKGLPLLEPSNIVPCEQTFLVSGSYSGKRNEIHLGFEKSKKSKDRSKTFSGIAKAMAAQWNNADKFIEPQISLFEQVS